MRSCGRAISKYSAVMMEITEAQEAWWPLTFSPSRLGRMWLALWIIHDDSQSSLRSSCFRMCVRSVVARGGSAGGWSRRERAGGGVGGWGAGGGGGGGGGGGRRGGGVWGGYPWSSGPV